VNVDGAKKLSEELGEDRVLAPGRVDVTDEVGLNN
jgi:hypothetical protein